MTVTAADVEAVSSAHQAHAQAVTCLMAGNAATCPECATTGPALTAGSADRTRRMLASAHLRNVHGQTVTIETARPASVGSRVWVLHLSEWPGVETITAHQSESTAMAWLITRARAVCQEPEETAMGPTDEQILARFTGGDIGATYTLTGVQVTG